MPRPYKPLAFANEFILMSGGAGVEHMKLQKLVYMSYGWWLAYHDDPVLNEAPQVWKHGPVFKSLYFALSSFGRSPITTVQTDNPFAPPPRVDDTDTDVLGLISWIWARYGAFTAYYLSDLTHKPGTPWRNVAEKHNFLVPKNMSIPTDEIKKHYRNLAREFGLSAK